MNKHHKILTSGLIVMIIVTASLIVSEVTSHKSNQYIAKIYYEDDIGHKYPIDETIPLKNKNTLKKIAEQKIKDIPNQKIHANVARYTLISSTFESGKRVATDYSENLPVPQRVKLTKNEELLLKSGELVFFSSDKERNLAEFTREVSYTSPYVRELSVSKFDETGEFQLSSSGQTPFTHLRPGKKYSYSKGVFIQTFEEKYLPVSYEIEKSHY